jgi:hypothetical protein
MPEGLLALLEDFPGRLKSHLTHADPGALDYTPDDWTGVPSEVLTIRQQICHLRDVEVDGYLVRIARTLAETAPFLPSVDTDSLIAARHYNETPIDDAFNEFARARKRTLALLASADSADFARTADFEGYGRVTLNGLAHFLISHDQQHLAGIHWLIGKAAGAVRNIS